MGGDAVGDDIVGRTFPFPTNPSRIPPPPLGDFNDNDYFSLVDEDDDDVAGRAMQRRRQRGGGRQILRGRIDPRAEEYNRFLGLGPPPDVVSDDLLLTMNTDDSIYHPLDNDNVGEALHTSTMILIYSILMMESILILNHCMPQIVIWIWQSQSPVIVDHDDRGRIVPSKEIVSRPVMV